MENILHCVYILIVCSMLFCLNHYHGSDLVINEFLTSNTKGIVLDESNEAEDYIEIYNSGDEPVSIGDFFLSDDSTDLEVFRFPDTMILPKSYIVVWADNDTKQGKLHAAFKLSANDGDEIILSSKVRIIDRIQFFAHNNNPQARLPDISYGRRFDGDTLWVRQKQLTPGVANSGL